MIIVLEPYAIRAIIAAKHPYVTAFSYDGITWTASDNTLIHSEFANDVTSNKTMK